jgi:hypothetical protein
MGETRVSSTSWRKEEGSQRHRNGYGDGLQLTASDTACADQFRTVDIVSQTTVDKLVTSFVVKGMHALSTVEQPEFIELVTGLCCSAKVMSRRTLGRRIDDSFNDKLQQIKETIAKVQTVCTTADV